MSDKCSDCKGKGSIALLHSVVKCDVCGGTGRAESLAESRCWDVPVEFVSRSNLEKIRNAMVPNEFSSARPNSVSIADKTDSGD